MKNGKLSIFDLNKPGKEKFMKEISVFDTNKEVRLVRYRRSTNEVFVGDESGQVSVWSLKTGEVLSDLVIRRFSGTLFDDDSDGVVGAQECFDYSW